MDITFTLLFQMLKENLWVGLLAAFLFGIWKSSPKVFNLFENYFKSKEQELINIKNSIERGDERLSVAVDKVSQAIFSFEKGLLAVRGELKQDIKDSQHDIKTEIASTRGELIKEIRDSKLENLLQSKKRDKNVNSGDS